MPDIVDEEIAYYRMSLDPRLWEALTKPVGRRNANDYRVLESYGYYHPYKPKIPLDPRLWGTDENIRHPG